MRRSIATLVAAAALLVGPGALAAPTCDDRNGDTIKCGTPGAMPVGWTPSPAGLLDRPVESAGLGFAETAALIYILVALFALIALMPEFDGWGDGDWDEQEGDDRPRR